MLGPGNSQKAVKQFRFAVVSDPHVALTHTIQDIANRFHLVEISIPALEIVFEHLETLNLDFLLLPGDLTQDGEPDNHAWLAQRLAALPFPAYVIPGNHDVAVELANHRSIGLTDFPSYYLKFGYDNPEQLYYSHEVLPGVRLIGLNSNQFDERGKQIGRMDEEQLQWLQGVLDRAGSDELILVTIHHNVLEHLPGQSTHAMGRRYMLDNAPCLRKMLRAAGVNFVFTGHLHVQDVAYADGLYDITTGSLVSYPHPYRVLEYAVDERGQGCLHFESHRVKSVPGWPALGEISREWMGDRSHPFMMKLLTCPPLNLPPEQAEELAPHLRYFWADIANGDGLFDFPQFPPRVRRYFQTFSALASDRTPQFIDNQATLML